MNIFRNLTASNRDAFNCVVPLDKSKDILLHLDLTANNPLLTEDIYTDTMAFTNFINHQISDAGARYGVGGYDEHRVIYNRSTLFDSTEEPRRLHLGLDIWGPAGTPVLALAAGHIHSLGNNDAFGDYGGTIILEHLIDDIRFYSLYGHLSASAVQNAGVGKQITKGEQIAIFGQPTENGGWPPHLHFQLIMAIGAYSGDYPGVCRLSEKEQWLSNSPDPAFVLELI